MSLRLYMDAHVHIEITEGLVRRNIDVLTAQQDGNAHLPDDQLLNRATALGRVLFSCDEDLLAEAALRQRDGQSFAGVIYAHQLAITIGQCINDLEMLAVCLEPDDMAGRVEYLPIK